MHGWRSSAAHSVCGNSTPPHGGMPAPEQPPPAEEGLLLTTREVSSTSSPSSVCRMEPHSVATNILASVKEQELQFERLTRELEAERQIVASQLERCRLGSESPGAASASSSEKSFPWRSADVSTASDTKPRVTDGSQSPTYCIRSELEQVTLYSPEQTSLHERSGGNSRSSTQMNSYSDSGYQDACSYYSSQNLGKAELRLQHSYPGTGSGGGSAIARHARPEGQASVQVAGSHSTASGRAMRRVSSVPSRTQSPAYGSSASPSRGSLRTLLGSAYSSPVATEPKPPSAVFSASTLPASQQPCSPASLRRVGSASSRPGSAGRNASPYRASGHASSPADGPPAASTSPSPVRSGMTAVPQHYGSTLPRSLAHESDPFGQRSYDLYERMVPPRPDSLADALVDEIQGLRSSYASQHSPMGQELRATVSPDRHITPIYEDRTFQSPLYRSRNHSTVDLNHSSQSAIYRTGSGVGNLQRTLSQRSTMTYHRGNYGVNSAAAYAEPYHSGPYHSTEPSYGRQAIAADGGATRSPSIDSIQKDPREFAWRDPELPEVIHMLQHQFPSVQANAAAYLQHLCFGDNRIKAEVCRLGGIKHLVDLLDHKVLEVQRNACGALRNLVYGKATDENKTAVRNVGGVPALLRLLRKTSDAEIRELVTGVLWNLSSCDAVKMTIIRDALSTLTNTVIIPHSGWSSSGFDDEHKLKFHSSLVLRNTTGCLRNLSSAGEEARKQMRCCEGLVDSLLHVIKACVNTSDFDSKIVENCICTLRNLSYRLELEMPQSRLLGAQELDGLLGSESPSRDVESSCWGRKKKKKKKSSQDDQWDGVGPIPGFSKSPKGAEMLWHPAVVKPYLTLLAESSNPATLEGSAGSLQNLSAGNWKFAAYIRAAVRKEKGLPILVELLRMDNDRVVCSVATALRNMALDVRNKELIGKYAMRDLVNRLPGGNTTLLSDETVAAICCTLHEVTSKNMENAKALADTGGIEKLVSITKGRGERYSMKVVKAAAQVLNTLWQYRDLRAIYKKDGWNQNHFITPVSTLERDKYKSQPALPSSTLQMSPVIQSAGSATSSPAMLGIKEHRSNYQRTQSAMQFYKYQGDGNVNKYQYTGSGKPSPFFIGSYSSPTREEPRRAQHQLYYADEPSRRNHDTYRMYLQSPRGYEDPYFEDGVHFPPAADYSSSQPQALKSTANYVDFYSTTRRPSYRAEQYPGSPDSWV
ncbi:plakophilin-4 isoform X2 [Scleropages formosus]|uniref:plakophilin-4 isoform X2 n=1 Tax=Scleropages formosus TaxID=113540 RepID=UPI0010FABAE9|nr:plakophilin-4 isoform X2 [Scleropages formosus]